MLALFDSPQNHRAFVVRFEDTYKIIRKHADFASCCYCTFPPAARLSLYITYDGTLN